MKIIIEGLAVDISADDIRRDYGGYAPIQRIDMVRYADHAIAIVEMDISRAQANFLAARICAQVRLDTQLRAWVPLWDKD
ncbi:hypothetical protein WH50_22800 [Pokkaliibacter plantistimulans]|uniref:RRM domain-containing protein n=1 Tax=Pokkaliibacter plantistimulans TaxID=1635171 RepID=A0ABX5LQY1_9GAMM|nr:hypothetical protein [Pokkaliibacter plantistimulans]PXF29066.1 hypothetical protein WH50_22800 [Pokkaliibacter plantistimulans]